MSDLDFTFYFIVAFVGGLVIGFLCYNIENNNSSKAEYCKSIYGQEYYLDGKDLPKEIWSCKTITENGTMITKYFTNNKYDIWVKEQKE